MHDVAREHIAILLITVFLTGVGAARGFFEITNQVPVLKSRLDALQKADDELTTLKKQRGETFNLDMQIHQESGERLNFLTHVLTSNVLRSRPDSQIGTPDKDWDNTCLRLGRQALHELKFKIVRDTSIVIRGQCGLLHLGVQCRSDSERLLIYGMTLQDNNTELYQAAIQLGNSLRANLPDLVY